MENTPTFHPLDYVSVLRRRVWWLTVPLVLAAVVGAALVMWLPRTYKTTATVGVALPTLSAELVTSASRVTPEDRLRGFQQVLMSGQVSHGWRARRPRINVRSSTGSPSRRGLAVDTLRDAPCRRIVEQSSLPHRRTPHVAAVATVSPMCSARELRNARCAPSNVSLHQEQSTTTRRG